MATKKKVARKVTAKKSPTKKAATKKRAAKKAPAKKAVAKKSPAKKAARRIPAQKTQAKKAAAKKTARRAPAKKTARKAPAKKAARGGASPSLAPTEQVPKHLWLHDDRFDPLTLTVKQGQEVHVISARKDDEVPVHVPECFGPAGTRPIKPQDTLILRVLPNAKEGPYQIKAPPKSDDPHTDLKGDIEVVSKD
jgi:hypothetical protein